MKKIMLSVFMLSFITFHSSVSQAQIYVNVRPTVVVNDPRPMCPSPRHIWIEPDYVWRNGKYVLVNGYWAEPRVGYRYIPGQWKYKKRRGHCWVPARWVRVSR